MHLCYFMKNLFTGYNSDVVAVSWVMKCHVEEFSDIFLVAPPQVYLIYTVSYIEVVHCVKKKEWVEEER